MAKHMKEVHPLQIKKAAIQKTLFGNNKRTGRGQGIELTNNFYKYE